jgi:hypothetical protein
MVASRSVCYAIPVEGKCPFLTFVIASVTTLLATSCDWEVWIAEAWGSRAYYSDTMLEFKIAIYMNEIVLISMIYIEGLCGYL